MFRVAAAFVGVASVGVVALMLASNAAASEPRFLTQIPRGYRDWRLVTVAHEKGELNDLRAVLANDKALMAFREGKAVFPDGAIIARLAYDFVPSEENNRAFGREQSFVAGAPKNNLQFMAKDSKKYASTGGWGYGEFDFEGKAVEDAVNARCFPCHQAVKGRDFVFSRYAP